MKRSNHSKEEIMIILDGMMTVVEMMEIGSVQNERTIFSEEIMVSVIAEITEDDHNNEVQTETNAVQMTGEVDDIIEMTNVTDVHREKISLTMIGHVNNAQIQISVSVKNVTDVTLLGRVMLETARKNPIIIDRVNGINTPKNSISATSLSSIEGREVKGVTMLITNLQKTLVIKEEDMMIEVST